MSPTGIGRRKLRPKPLPAMADSPPSPDILASDVPVKQPRRAASSPDRPVVEPFCTSNLVDWCKRFSDMQKTLVTSIGFDFVLRLPAFDSIDRQFALRLFDGLLVEEGVLVSPDGRRAEVTVEAVSEVIGVETGTHQIRIGGNPSDEVVAAVEKMICDGRSKKRSYVEHAGYKLEALIGPGMKESQHTDFLAALVVYTVANFLAPRPDGRHVDADVLEAATNPSLALKTHWASYIRCVLFAEARRIKEELRTKKPEDVSLGGCCIFLQVFFMEKFYPVDSRMKRRVRHAIEGYDQKILSDLIWCYEDDLRKKARGADDEITDSEILARFKGGANRKKSGNEVTARPTTDLVSNLVQDRKFVSFFDDCFEGLLSYLMPGEKLPPFCVLRQAKYKAKVNVSNDSPSVQRDREVRAELLQSATPIRRPLQQDSCRNQLLDLFPASGKLALGHQNVMTTTGGDNLDTLKFHGQSPAIQQFKPAGGALDIDTTLTLSLQALITPKQVTDVNENSIQSHTNLHQPSEGYHVCNITSAATVSVSESCVSRSVIFRQTPQKDGAQSVTAQANSPSIPAILRSGQPNKGTEHQSQTVPTLKPKEAAAQTLIMDSSNKGSKFQYKKRAQKQLGLITDNQEQPAMKTRRLSNIDDDTPISPFDGFMLPYHVEPSYRESMIRWLLSKHGSSIRGLIWFRSKVPDDCVILFGTHIVTQLLDENPISLSIAMMAAIMLLYKDQDDKLYARFPKRRWRHWLTPGFYFCCMKCTKEQVQQEFITTFTFGHLNYNPSNCVLVFCPITFHHSWMFIAFNLKEQRVTIIDPIIPPTQVTEPDEELTKIVRVVLDALLHCLNVVSPRPWHAINQWPIVICRADGPNGVDFAESGRVSALMAMEFDGTGVRGNWTWNSVKNGAKQMVADMLDTPCNKITYGDLFQLGCRRL
ncbi:hypothetical protein ACP70R_023055 [Stipagrostis hirtigluma subsp. patula]